MLSLRSIPFFLSALIAMHFSASGAVAADGRSAAVLITQGDRFDSEFEPTSALEYYLPAEKLTPEDPALLLRIARQYRHLMSEKDAKADKLRLGYVAVDYAERAARLAPKNSEAQLSPAISYGKMTPFMGSRDQVKTSPLIKESADRALTLDPRNDTAWYILGRWNRVLADVSGVKRALAGAIYGKLPKTTNEAAEKCILTAISIDRSRLMHFVELGRIQAQMGNRDEARRSLKKAISMPNREHDDPENKRIARETLQSLK